MSDLTSPEAKAVFARLNVPQVTGAGLATGGVFYEEAPKNAAMPYVIFDVQAPLPVVYSFGPTHVMEGALWTVKTVLDQKSAAPDTCPERAARILAACDAQLRATVLQLSTGVNLWCQRFSDMPKFAEIVSDRTIRHYGFILKLVSRKQ